MILPFPAIEDPLASAFQTEPLIQFGLGGAVAALAYFVLPIDAVPDFLVGVGFGDDAAVLLATIAMVRTHITPIHREAARNVLAEEVEPTGS